MNTTGIRLYMCYDTGEVMSYRDALQYATDNYDIDDDTNGISLDEYFEDCGYVSREEYLEMMKLQK